MKTEVTLAVESELVKSAVQQDIDLAQALEEALAARVKHARADHWLEENKSALDTYSRYLEENELFGDEHRTF